MSAWTLVNLGWAVAAAGLLVAGYLTERHALCYNGRMKQSNPEEPSYREREIAATGLVPDLFDLVSDLERQWELDARIDRAVKYGRI